MESSPEYCRLCGKPNTEVGKLSLRGRCNTCARTNVEQAPEQIINRSGPHYDAWVEGQRRALEPHVAA